MVRIVKEKIRPEELKKIAEDSFGTLIKVAVDVEKDILAAGGEWHSKGQDLLVRQEGSTGENVWGANFHLFEKKEKRIDYFALINLKPGLGNRDMEIQDASVRRKVKEILEQLLLTEDETLSP